MSETSAPAKAMEDEIVVEKKSGNGKGKQKQIADPRNRQILAFDFHNRDIHACIASGQFAIKLATVLESHADFGCAVYDMVVGEDVTIGPDDDARGAARGAIAQGGGA